MNTYKRTLCIFSYHHQNSQSRAPEMCRQGYFTVILPYFFGKSTLLTSPFKHSTSHHFSIKSADTFIASADFLKNFYSFFSDT
jgi:hypothetical protein